MQQAAAPSVDTPTTRIDFVGMPRARASDPTDNHQIRLAMLKFKHGTANVLNRIAVSNLATLVCLVALASVLTVSRASAQFGIAAGANFESLGDLDDDGTRASFDRATGYHVGLFANFGVGFFAIQPGIYLRDFGKVSLVKEAGSRTFSLTAIEIPVDLRLHLMRGGPASPFVFAGPVVGFNRTTDESLEDVVTDVTLSANIGAGLELTLPRSGMALTPEIRFARSLTRFFEEGEEFDLAGQDFTPIEVSKQSAVMLRLGLRF